MLKKLFFFFYCLFCAFTVKGQVVEIQIDTTDIQRFYQAYDLVLSERDSLARLQIVRDVYLNKATPGLKGLLYVRDYQDYEYVDAMLSYQRYWNSVRFNAKNLLKDQARVNDYFMRLKSIFPMAKEGVVYFPVGAFRSGGTYFEQNVLLGAEFWLADENADLTELPARLQEAIQETVKKDLPLTVLHEFIHTQQKPWTHQSIVHISLAEGVAEYISTMLSNAPLSPPVAFGKANEKQVVERFMIECVRDNDVWNWLWNANENELKVRDLAYYIGYEVCERYVKRSEDKRMAIQELIALEYDNEEQFERVLDGSGFLPLTWSQIGERYESLRPTITGIKEFENGSKRVSHRLKTITLEFSEPMNACCRSIDFNESLGAEMVKIKRIIGWSDDMRSFSFEVEKLKRKTNYNIIFSAFAKEDGGNRLAPYSISFTTR